MTLSDVEKIPKKMLSVADVAPYLYFDPDTLIWQAQNEPRNSGLPVTYLNKGLTSRRTHLCSFVGLGGRQ